MKRLLTGILACVLLLGGLTACAEGEQTRGDMGFSVLEQVYVPGENAVLSPLSLKLALAMAALGAQGDTREQIDAWIDSETFAQTVAALRESLAEKGVTFANGAFVHPDCVLTEQYTQVLDEKLLAELFAMPADAVKDAVNEWVKENTNGMIEALLEEEPDEDVRLMLLNALALDAKWETPFNAATTAEGVFHGTNGEETVSYMYGGDMSLRYGETAEGRWVRLPYEDGSLCMYVFLPEADMMAQALSAFAENGASYVLGDSLNADVALTLPKFSLSGRDSLKGALSALGMTDMFGMNADFSGMTGADELFVSEVLQSVRIDVDEAGTKAAAATQIEMTLKSAYNPDIVEFTVDRPFIMAIIDETSGETLFAACVETLAE